MEADALSCGWRGCRRGADIDEREVIASRRGRAIERATNWSTAARAAAMAADASDRIVSDPYTKGRSGDRARLACSESARHVVCDAEQNVSCDCGMLSTVPWGVVRSALHVGRREGDAVWHQRSDRRIPPPRTVVKLSHHGCHHAYGSRPGRRPGRHAKAKFASCAQTPSRSVGPAPAGSERSAEPWTASSTAPH